MIFLRHPRPDVEPGICYGRLDLDIHEDGHAQIDVAVGATPRIRNLIASPAKRCRKLALALADHQGLEVTFDDRLWEMHMGEWEGIPWRDIPRETSESWLKDPFNRACPGGESFCQVQARVLKALDGVEFETAIICHAGPIRAVQMAWQGLTFAEAFAQAPPYAEPLRITPPQAQGKVL